MEFENQYLEYDEYKELGGNLLEMPFNLLEFKSRKEIDKMTSNRISNLVTIPMEVKLCINELISVFEEDEKPIFASDGVGTYNPSKRDLKDIEKIRTEIIKRNLKDLVIDGENALYCGVN